MLRIDVITIFPELFEPFLSTSLLGAAIEAGGLEVALHDLRDWTEDRHRSVDDEPYGGGPGMVMKPEPLFRAVESVADLVPDRGRVVLLTPQGRLLGEAVAAELAGEERLLLICGHYEGVDERVREHLVDDEISIGDYVLSGGELPAMVVVDAVVRRLPGAIGSGLSLEELAERGLPPAEAMALFEAWLAAQVPSGWRPIFVAFNAPFDWMFVNDYFHRFLGRNPFGHAALDLKAFYMGLTGVHWSETTMRYVAARYLSDRQLTHHALCDAQDQAELFRKMLTEAAVRG